MTSRSVLVAMVFGGIVGLNVAGEPEVVTETVTEQVEVPGPTVVRSVTVQEELPESCLSMIDNYLGQVDYLRDYSEAMGQQPMALRRAAIAAHQQDVELINAAITEQSQIESGASAPLREIIQGQVALDDLQERCEQERGESP